MLLLPYAHERQTVQRLPWITFGLIALNLLIFLITTYGASGAEDAERFMYEFREYLYARPYLEVPESMKELLDEEELEQLAIYKETTDTSALGEFTIQQEQL